MSSNASNRPNSLGPSGETPPEEEYLVFEGAWLRRLARQLVRDSHRAEDAVQATLVAAWSRPRGEARPSRSWLARVLRNFVHQDARSEARRSEREALVARPDQSEPERSTLDRLEVQRRVVDAIESLPEPYRTTIVLRFLDDLPPRTIAAKTQVPTKTVYTRIKRGLAQLRGQLDHTWNKDEEGHTNWRRALLALPGMTTKTTTILAGVTAMGSATGSMAKTGLGVVGAAMLIAGAVYVFGPENTTAKPNGTGGVAPDSELAAHQSEANMPQPSVESGGTRLNDDTPPEEDGAVPPTLQGIVVDLDDAPVAGVRVTLSLGSGVEEGLSDAQGLFNIKAPRPLGHHPSPPSRDASWAPGSHGYRYVVMADDPNWVCLAGSTTRASELRVVVARATQLHGTVIDENGQPLAGAQVRYFFPLALTLGLQADSNHVPGQDIQAKSGPEGTFEMQGLAAVAGATLIATKQGYRSTTIDLNLPDSEAQVLSLERPRAGDREIEGRVFGPDGRPFAGALVSAHSTAIESDQNGWFVVQLPEPDKNHREADSVVLTALAEGLLPARHPIDVTRPLPGFVELRLGGPSLAIEGRVVDGGGAPIGAALIWVGDLTFFGYVTEEKPGISFDIPRNVEELLATEGKRPQGVYTTSKPDGTFQLKGLLDRDYNLMAMDESNLAFVEFGAVPAGTSRLEIKVSPATTPVSVSGRVVGHDGLPIPFAVVTSKSVQHDTYRLPYRSQHVFTDAKGRFEFDGLVAEDLMLNVGGVDIATRLDGFRFTEEDDLGGLELVVGRIVRFKITSTQEEFSSAHFSVLDAEGDPLSMSSKISGQWIWGLRSELTDGVTGIIEVEDSATTLLIEVDGREPLLLPLRLERGSVAEIAVP